MEVTTDEEAQTVLLDSGVVGELEGAQYITIQRADGESLGKGVPLFTLNGELLSEGMVVDMINGVGTDYATGTQYYETEDLLPHVLTEEDRRLAAALVAVQLQQQQKHQQMQSHQSPDDTLEDVRQLEGLTPVNAYAIETIQEANAPVYAGVPLHTFKRGWQHVKEEYIKCEDDVDISAESSEDAVATPGPKRSLPHKKRIARKLKQQSKKNVTKRDSARANQNAVSNEIVSKDQGNSFKCELCGNKFNGQLKFFEHLKSHYEPFKEERRLLSQAVNNNTTSLTVPSIPEPTVQVVVENTIEEFSEPEDIMEGIRDVVEETGAQIDDDDDDEDPLPETHNGSIWTISEIPEQLEPDEIEEPSTINQEDLFEQDEAIRAPDVSKKKKIKPKKPTDELSCPSCDRSFHHKNSLVYHMRSHSGERPHQCDVCGKSFFAASALKVHKRLHSGIKPYKCEDCGRHFRQWGDLKYHSTSLHSEQRQFQCEYCGKDFARKYSLIVHRRIHTGEKNYRCEYCNKTFRASSYLQNHRRIHTGEKPHPCDVCGKPFRVRSDMKRHMLTHTRSASRAQAKKAQANDNGSGDESDEGGMAKTSRTISEIVHGLKLEVAQGAAVVELVGAAAAAAAAAGDDNTESILPHANVQTLEYAAAAASHAGAAGVIVEDDDLAHDRDPLEAVVRTSDSLNFDMQQLYSINL